MPGMGQQNNNPHTTTHKLKPFNHRTSTAIATNTTNTTIANNTTNSPAQHHININYSYI